MTEVYTMMDDDYEYARYLRGDDLLSELEVCNLLNEHAALSTWVRETDHDSSCIVSIKGPGLTCDCGLDRRLASLPERLKDG